MFAPLLLDVSVAAVAKSVSLKCLTDKKDVTFSFWISLMPLVLLMSPDLDYYRVLCIGLENSSKCN